MAIGAAGGRRPAPRRPREAVFALSVAVVWSISIVAGALLGFAKSRPVLGLVLGFVPVVGPFAVALVPGREPAAPPSAGARAGAAWAAAFPAWQPELCPPPIWPTDLSPLRAWPPPPPTTRPPS